ncbi:MAG: response regulator [Vicinamibacterales bacterium]|jgi:CheY-like chemotaxis protein
MSTSSTMANPQSGKHILVVDDYADALDIWAIYLQTMGYRVSTAADGLSAVAQAERLLPDLVVLDLELPGLSGFEAAKRLRENPATREIPLIAATGYSHARQLDLARQSGFDAVVVKPCDPDMLVQEIERLLPARREQLQPSRPAVEQPHNNG